MGHAHTRTHTHRHTHTHTHTIRHTQTHTQTYTHTHARTHTHTLTIRHTQSDTHNQTHTETHTQIHTHTQRETHKQTHTYARAQTNTRTQCRRHFFETTSGPPNVEGSKYQFTILYITPFLLANGPEKFELCLGVELIQDDDIFYSVLVSMGMMGVIYSYTFEVRDAFYVKEDRRLMGLHELTNKMVQNAFHDLDSGKMQRYSFTLNCRRENALTKKI